MRITPSNAGLHTMKPVTPSSPGHPMKRSSWSQLLLLHPTLKDVAIKTTQFGTC